MFKRIVTLLLAVAMLLSMCALVGCGGNGGAGGNKGQVAGNNDDEEFFLDMPEELRGTVVEFATWIDHTKTDTALCLTSFAETTGMRCELVQVNQSDYITKVMGLIQSDQAPDVIVENGDFPKTLNLLMPLEKETSGLDPKDPFWDQQITDIFTIGGKSYLVNGKNSSWDMTSHMTYYHKTILEENGIPTPTDLLEQDNWNLDSMWTLMEQIKAGCGLSGPGTGLQFEAILHMYGANLINWNSETDRFENALNDPNVQKAFDYLMRAKDQGLARVNKMHDSDIETGTIVLEITGAYGLRKSPGWFFNMDVDDLGFELLPKVNKTDADQAYTGSTRAYGICKGSENPVGAGYFLRFFLNEANYDIDQIFKNDEAKELYYKLKAKQDNTKPNFTTGAIHVLDPKVSAYEMVTDLVRGTAAQVQVNLNKANNQCESYVEAANKLIKEVIDNQ